MKIRILAVGGRAPQWVEEGYAEYAKRLSREFSLELIEITPPKHQGDVNRFKQLEADKINSLVKPKEYVVALDEHGRQVDSKTLAKRLAHWRDQGRDVAFLIGGSDGLADELLQRADEKLALSHLTLPHYMVRVVLGEALYRAQSILQNHPYHRA